MYKRIRDLREDKDLSQKEIASILNMSQTGYSKYEVGTTVNLNVIRSNQAITVTLTIADANNVSNE